MLDAVRYPWNAFDCLTMLPFVELRNRRALVKVELEWKRKVLYTLLYCDDVDDLGQRNGMLPQQL
jgi:hypothetical protein